MKLLTQSLLVSVALALAACGGSGESNNIPAQPGNPDPPTQEPPNQEPPQANNEPYVIDYYGDSTIWGWASGSNAGRVATPAPQAFLNALPTPPQNIVRNEGVNGSTACALLEGTDGEHPPWGEQLAASGATHVIINHGINDQDTYDVARYRSCLGALATIARQHEKQVVFETPNPVSGEGLLPYVEAMRAVAAAQQPAVPVIDQYQHLTDYLDGRGVEEIAPDGVHPSQEVYIMKGEYAAEVFMGYFPR